MEQDVAADLEVLRATNARLKAALKGVPRKLALWTPAPGKWSIQEIVCHMRDMEEQAYLDRYRRILDADDARLPDVDGDVAALEGGYRSRKLPEVLRDWSRLRKECLALLKRVKGDGWARTGTLEGTGPVSLAALVRRHARGNDAAHLEQIQEIKSRFGVLGVLAGGPQGLKTATAGLADEALRRKPAPDKWSILEIACHLRDVERVFADRFTKMAFRERPQLWVMDNERVARALGYTTSRLDDVLKEFARLRGDTLTLLRALPPAVWQRAGLHPKRGEVSIADLARVLADHDRSHLERMRALR
jgi:DinB superfamily